MQKFEYLKWYWKFTDKDTPIILFYEVDLQNERYATRMTEVFYDRKAVPVVEEGWEFVTEAPVPTVDEINMDDDFYAEIITWKEFEDIYNSKEYMGNIIFPKGE